MRYAPCSLTDVLDRRAVSSTTKKSEILPNMTEISPRVLIIEDEEDLRDAVINYLRLDGFIAEPAANLRQATERLNKEHYDVVLLDLGLPDGDGLKWLQQRPERARTGLIITTARTARSERVTGALLGADSYFVKPVDLEELSLHAQNLTRRVRRNMSERWELNTEQWHLITPTGTTIKLTRSEVRFLQPLMHSPGAPVPRSELVTSLGHDLSYYDARRMEIMVRRLRQKVEAQSGDTLPLETIYGRGFAFTAPAKVSIGVD